MINLIFNSSKKDENINHLSTLKEMTNGADEVIFSVAYFKNNISEEIADILSKCDRNCTITIFVSKHNPDTHSSALRKFKRKLPNAKVFYSDKNKIYFHSKIYFTIRGDDFCALIGSANLTKGGLISNEEASVFVGGSINGEFKPFYKQVVEYFDRLKCLRNDGAFSEFKS